MAQEVVENIVKQGYLRRTNSSGNRFSGLFKRQESSKWFVLLVRQNSPYLQQYDADVDVFSRRPLHSYSLAQCKAVRSMGSSDPPTFCVVCPDRVIELIAASRTQMLDWVTTVESCLIDLGVIKKEPVEHVYTVCPAVVRKPRVSKEVLEEREAEALAQAASVGVPSRPAPDPPPAVQVNDQPATSPYSNSVSSTSLVGGNSVSRANTSSVEGASAMNPRPRVPARSMTLKETSSSMASASWCPPPKEINAANVIDHLPPPIPNRPASEAATAAATLSPKYSVNPLIHPITGSSNDSDFVSPEVIAQLRVKKSNGDIDASDQAASLQPFVSNASNRSDREASDISPSVRIKPSIDLNPVPENQTLEKWTAPPDLTLSNSSSLSSLSSSPEMAETKGFFNRNSASPALENEYSLLPSHSGACALPTSALDKIYTQVSKKDSSLDVYYDNASKPIPRPRHVLVKQACLPDELQSQESSDIHSALNFNDVYDNMLKPQLSKDPEQNGCPSRDAHESHEGDKHTDENENCYGLIFDPSGSNGPLSPPILSIPPIPPLPPRHDSLLEAPQSPSTSCAATTRPANGNGVDAPPLPLPRRNPSISRYGASARASTSNASMDLEIPPMPPRRRSPNPSKVQSCEVTDDRPPALPSRPSQSFYIKRPQLMSQFDSNSSTGHAAATPETNESDTASSQPGLSRMMLLDRAHSLHTVVSLKQTQAEILQSEISMPSIALTLTQKSGHGLALVDWNGLPCVVGWNQRDFPSLHGKLHLGDQLISVNGVKVPSVDVAQKLLRGATTPKITVVLHRMPYAKVYAIRRDAEGQSLGIKREGGTGEIVYVDPNGLAAQYGLTAYASGMNCELRCNWFITEINNRPISLFFKENEIEHRLSAVGREISIVVQPSDFIHEIRRQFKKIKNYKNYITL